MPSAHKILLVDDDQDLLDLYREILGQLPSKPEISTSLTGARAMAMLEADTYTLMVCDLNMPKMDGLQVLSIVRRKYPELRTVVLTSVMDEQFRSRAYGLGIDLFWQKPSSNEEITQLLECIESLLGRETQTGFRGVQSKSLVDLIQLECLSHNSTVLKIINGPFSGRIWIQNGEVIDAETEGSGGEPAFHKILAWKSGNFEALMADATRPRVIFNSYQGLLLETAQAQDEAQAAPADKTGGVLTMAASAPAGTPASLAPLSEIDGVEFVLALKADAKNGFDVRGLENPQPVANWSRDSLAGFRTLGDRLEAGPLQNVEGRGPQRHVTLSHHDQLDVCLGWRHSLSAEQIRESLKKIFALWES